MHQNICPQLVSLLLFRVDLQGEDRISLARRLLATHHTGGRLYVEARIFELLATKYSVIVQKTDGAHDNYLLCEKEGADIFSKDIVIPELLKLVFDDYDVLCAGASSGIEEQLFAYHAFLKWAEQNVCL